MMLWIPYVLSILFLVIHETTACSDVLVTRGASTDGSSFVAYNADDVRLYGALYHYPKTKGKPGEMVNVYDWDSGVSRTTVLREIHTYTYTTRSFICS
jgi:dipeptidase